MKPIFIFLITILLGILVLSCEKEETTGILKDERDSKNYKTVKIGNQVWMAENLRFDAGEKSKAYDNSSYNAITYGLLYDYDTICDVCPEGWRIPVPQDWMLLEETIEAIYERDDIAGLILREEGYSHWKYEDMGTWNDVITDPLGFSALPGGWYDDWNRDFYGIGSSAIFWAYNDNSGCDYCSNISIGYDYANLLYDSDGSNWSSIRCIKE
jgi:uncharacterized protein (TIGR02145 family)